ncbi:Type IV secretory pathway VirD4 protein-like protein, partial [mine drainage metagenome]
MSKSLSSFKNPYIVQMCQVGPSDSLDVADFLARRGVVYLVGSSESQAVVASIIATFVEDLIEKARMIEKPISPPMCLWLDEVANIVPLPKLPQLYSTGRGDGIYLASVLQSYSQAEQTWGREGADTMHANAVVEVHLSGSKDTAMLSWLSQAGGQRDTTSRSRSY